MSNVAREFCRLLAVESVPDGWEVGRVGDVVSYAKRPRGLTVIAPIPFVPMALLSEREMTIKGWQAREPSAVGSGTYFEAGDLLVGRITPCFENGKQGIVPMDIPGGWGLATTEVYALRSEALDMRFLHFFLKIDAVRTSLIQAMEGATGRMRLPKEAIEGLPIAWPARGVQTMIVNRLVRLVAATADVEKELADTATLARKFYESLLEAAVRGAVTDTRSDATDYRSAVLATREEHWRDAHPHKQHYPSAQGAAGEPDFVPEGWTVMSLDEMTDGGRTSAYGVLQPGPHVENGVPLVRVGDLAQRQVRDDLKQIDRGIADSYRRTELQGGELLVSLVGTIGRCSVAPSSLAGANVARAVGMFPLGSEVVPEFVGIALSAPSAQRRLIGAANEVARKTLNLNDLRQFPVALPAPDDQRAIVARVTELEQIAVTAVQSSRRALHDLTRLRQSALRDAVTGRWPRGADTSPDSATTARAHATASRS